MKPLIVGTLSLFWLVTGLVGFMARDEAAAILIGRGLDVDLAVTAVLGGSILDMALGLAVAVRTANKRALQGMIATTLAYLAAGTFITPQLWLDPLGPFVKAIPATILALVALSIAEER